MRLKFWQGEFEFHKDDAKFVIPPLFALCVFSALLLFLPWHVLVAMHVEKFADSYRAWEWLAFLFGLIVLSASVIDIVWRTAHVHREIDKRLQHMTPMESSIVARILAGETIIKWPHEEGVQSLCQDGILWRETTGFQNGQFVYGLEKAVRYRAIALGMGKR
jgi:hypothetical protein